MHDQLTIAILGAGPAGMFAAHAASEAGHDFTIISKKRKSRMNGAQYLHQPIPGLSGEPFSVRYALIGTADGYRQKVYGDTEDVLVSPQTLVGTSDAWDIREAYDAAWDLYSHKIVDMDLSGTVGRAAIQGIVTSYDVVISTIPAYLLCDDEGHIFEHQSVWATEAVKSLQIFGRRGEAGREDNLVLCSGNPEDDWYRQSRIHNFENTEFPYENRPDGYAGKIHEVIKPLRHNCTCHPEVVRTGRYGKWTKGVLSHEAYTDAMEAIALAEQRVLL